MHGDIGKICKGYGGFQYPVFIFVAVVVQGADDLRFDLNACAVPLAGHGRVWALGMKLVEKDAEYVHFDIEIRLGLIGIGCCEYLDGVVFPHVGIACGVFLPKYVRLHRCTRRINYRRPTTFWLRFVLFSPIRTTEIQRRPRLGAATHAGSFRRPSITIGVPAR